MAKSHNPRESHMPRWAGLGVVTFTSLSGSAFAWVAACCSQKSQQRACATSDDVAKSPAEAAFAAASLTAPTASGVIRKLSGQDQGLHPRSSNN